MRLVSVEVIPYALPFKEPYVTARGTLTQREMVLLRLTTDEGIIGLGEAVPLSLRGGASLERVVRELREVSASEALQEFFARGALGVHSVGEIDPRLQLSAPAASAVLCAVADLYERLIYDDQPGRKRIHRAPITCNATLVAGSPTKVAEDAVTWAADGFSTFKLKLGVGDGLAQVRAVREAVGPAARIRVDVNGAWSVTEATELLCRLEPYDIELVEQPVTTMNEAVLLSRAVRIPLSGDESINTFADAQEAAELNAFQVACVKGSKVGSTYEAMKIGEAMPAYASSALDGPVGIALGAEIATDLEGFVNLLGPPRPQYAHGLATQRLFASTIAAVECELRDGCLHRPPSPGLGIEIDEEALQAHRL